MHNEQLHKVVLDRHTMHLARLSELEYCTNCWNLDDGKCPIYPGMENKIACIDISRIKRRG